MKRKEKKIQMKSARAFWIYLLITRWVLRGWWGGWRGRMMTRDADAVTSVTLLNIIDDINNNNRTERRWQINWHKTIRTDKQSSEPRRHWIELAHEYWIVIFFFFFIIIIINIHSKWNKITVILWKMTDNIFFKKKHVSDLFQRKCFEYN